MRTIKTKEREREPKLRNPDSKKPKELIKSVMLEAKEKSKNIPEKEDNKVDSESPVEYALDKVEATEKWAGEKTEGAVERGTRGLMKKVSQKRQERSNKGKAEKTVQEMQRAKNDLQSHRLSDNKSDGDKENARKNKHRGKTKRSIQKESIKAKPDRKQMISNQTGKSVKSVPRILKTSSIPKEADNINRMAMIQKKQVVQAANNAKKMATKSAQAAQRAAIATKRTIKAVAKGVSKVVKGTISAAKSMWLILGSAGSIVVLLILMIGVIGGILFSTGSQSTQSLSEEVIAYTPTIQKYADEYGIPEYTAVIQAIMMQESGGKGKDPMQSSECLYNKKFSSGPNGITDPEYSIQVGIQYYAECVKEAGCESPHDMERLKLSLQGYNYGNGYISWAINNHGGYSEANALEFSQKMAYKLGWSGYGDPEYVSHVLRYYSYGNLFSGLFGNEQIVSVALSQVGNEGGSKFWSWYGFANREEWCACFVSWCANQCGLIDAGGVPKFSYCPAGVEWFKNKGKWKEREYTPVAGTIIFFDRSGDGVSSHVGIVERYENGIVYTIEGNSGDAVKRRSYSLDNSTIMGYGVLTY